MIPARTDSENRQGRLGNALCFQGVAVATPEIQNVLRRSTAGYMTFSGQSSVMLCRSGEPIVSEKRRSERSFRCLRFHIFGRLQGFGNAEYAW